MMVPAARPPLSRDKLPPRFCHYFQSCHRRIFLPFFESVGAAKLSLRLIGDFKMQTVSSRYTAISYLPPRDDMSPYAHVEKEASAPPLISLWANFTIAFENECRFLMHFRAERVYEPPNGRGRIGAVHRRCTFACRLAQYHDGLRSFALPEPMILIDIC